MRVCQGLDGRREQSATALCARVDRLPQLGVRVPGCVEDFAVRLLPTLSMEFSMDRDPVITNPDLYKVVFENERVRVLEYLDNPGDRTEPHAHPDSVMYTLS